MIPNTDILLLSLYNSVLKQTKLAVQKAWDSCFHDTEPFEKLP